MILRILHHLVSLMAGIEIVPSLNLKIMIIMLASHLPHIPEYLSISSGAAEDVSDNCKEEEMLDPYTLFMCG